VVSLHAKQWPKIRALFVPSFSNHVNVVTALYSAINFWDFMLSNEADEADLTVTIVVCVVRQYYVYIRWIRGSRAGS
jgi:hypothetical protein